MKTPHLQATQISPRLRPGVEIYACDEGYVLVIDGECHQVRLDHGPAEDLLDTLTGPAPARPRTLPAQGALDQMILAGLTVEETVVVGSFHVNGDGLFASSVQDALIRAGAPVTDERGSAYQIDVLGARPWPGPSASPLAALLTCWIDADQVVLAPSGVSGYDLAARMRAAEADESLDPRLQPDPRGRRLIAKRSARAAGALDFAASFAAVEALRRQRIAQRTDPTAREHYTAAFIDLRDARIIRRPVLPVPAGPR